MFNRATANLIIHVDGLFYLPVLDLTMTLILRLTESNVNTSSSSNLKANLTHTHTQYKQLIVFYCVLTLVDRWNKYKFWIKTKKMQPK